MKLGMPPKQHPHIGINNARLAAECTSVLLFGRHYYDKYNTYAIHELPKKQAEAAGYRRRRLYEPEEQVAD
jgi:hypothetical protein